MCEADLSSADQVVIFKGDFACLQAINLTNSTTGDLVFMGGTKFLPVGVSLQQNVVQRNSLLVTSSVVSVFSPFPSHPPMTNISPDGVIQVEWNVRRVWSL